MTGGAGHDQADGSSGWPAQPPAQQAPFWMPGAADQTSAWDEPGWWRDQPGAGQPGTRVPRSPRSPRAPRSRRKLAVAGGIGVAGLAAALFLTGVVGPGKPAPGFHPTATDPAQAARQTAEAFLTAWQHGQVRKAASYTAHPD